MHAASGFKIAVTKCQGEARAGVPWSAGGADRWGTSGGKAGGAGASWGEGGGFWPPCL